MKKRRSKFGTASAREIVRGFLLAAATAILVALYNLSKSDQGLVLAAVDWQSMLSLGLGAGILYLLQRMTTNSDGKFMKREPRTFGMPKMQNPPPPPPQKNPREIPSGGFMADNKKD